MASKPARPNPEFLDYKNVPDYNEWIALPLRDDKRSLNMINGILENTRIGKQDPYGQIIYSLTGTNIKGKNAESHWKEILEHKIELEYRLGRLVTIKVAAIDYFDAIGNPSRYLASIAGKITTVDQIQKDNWLADAFSDDFFKDRCAEEVQRSKRYGHVLSLVLLDVDNFQTLNDKYGFKVADLMLTRLVQIVRKTVRVVDIMGRLSGDAFGLILPNANKREAQELAGRIRRNVQDRSKHFKEIESGFTVTLSVVQLNGSEPSSNEFIQRARSLLETGKTKKTNAVHVES